MASPAAAPVIVSVGADEKAASAVAELPPSRTVSREQFELDCPHRLEGLNWHLVQPAESAASVTPATSPQDQLAPSADRFNPQNPPFFVYPLKALLPFRGDALHVALGVDEEYNKGPQEPLNKKPLLIMLSVDGSELLYIEEEKIMLRRSAKSLRVLSDANNSNRFIVWYGESDAPLVHVVVNELYREELVELLKLASKPGFRFFEMYLLFLHQGPAMQRGNSMWAWHSRYLRIANGRLLVMRDESAALPMEAICINGVEVLPKGDRMIKCKSSDRKFLFRFETPADRETWMNAIAAARSRAQIEWQEMWSQNNKLGRHNSISGQLMRSASTSALDLEHRASEIKSSVRAISRSLDTLTKAGSISAAQQPPPRVGIEVHTIAKGVDHLEAKDSHKWEQIFVFSLREVRQARFRASMLHVNLVRRSIQYFFEEEQTAEKSAQGASVTTDIDGAANIYVHYPGDPMPIKHTLSDLADREVILDLLQLVATPGFKLLHISGMSVHRGICEKRSRSGFFWNRRYLVLINGRLLVYRDTKMPVPMTSITLSIKGVEERGEQSITVRTLARALTFRFDSSAEQHVWARAMRESVALGDVERREIKAQLTKALKRARRQEERRKNGDKPSSESGDPNKDKRARRKSSKKSAKKRSSRSRSPDDLLPMALLVRSRSPSPNRSDAESYSGSSTGSATVSEASDDEKDGEEKKLDSAQLQTRPDTESAGTALDHAPSNESAAQPLQQSLELDQEAVFAGKASAVGKQAPMPLAKGNGGAGRGARPAPVLVTRKAVPVRAARTPPPTREATMGHSRSAAKRNSVRSIVAQAQGKATQERSSGRKSPATALLPPAPRTNGRPRDTRVSQPIKLEIKSADSSPLLRARAENGRPSPASTGHYASTPSSPFPLPAEAYDLQIDLATIRDWQLRNGFDMEIPRELVGPFAAFIRNEAAAQSFIEEAERRRASEAKASVSGLQDGALAVEVDDGSSKPKTHERKTSWKDESRLGDKPREVRVTSVDDIDLFPSREPSPIDPREMGTRLLSMPPLDPRLSKSQLEQLAELAKLIQSRAKAARRAADDKLKERGHRVLVAGEEAALESLVEAPIAVAHEPTPDWDPTERHDWPARGRMARGESRSPPPPPPPIEALPRHMRDSMDVMDQKSAVPLDAKSAPDGESRLSAFFSAQLTRGRSRSRAELARKRAGSHSPTRAEPPTRTRGTDSPRSGSILEARPMEFRVDLLPSVPDRPRTTLGCVDVRNPEIMTLAEFRRLILDELDRLPKEFIFTRHGVPVGLRQEVIRNVKYAANADNVVNIKVPEPMRFGERKDAGAD